VMVTSQLKLSYFNITDSFVRSPTGWSPMGRLLLENETATSGKGSPLPLGGPLTDV